jgi:hypothetical protein
MAAEKPRAQVLEEYIAQLETLMIEWQDATDPESKWVLRLLQQAKEEAQREAHPVPEWLAGMLH